MDLQTELQWCYDEIDRLTGEVARLSRRPDNRKKLTPKEVKMIRDMHRAGFSQRDLADQFDVSQPTISRLVRGIYWGRT